MNINQLLVLLLATASAIFTNAFHLGSQPSITPAGLPILQLNGTFAETKDDAFAKLNTLFPEIDSTISGLQTCENIMKMDGSAAEMLRSNLFMLAHTWSDTSAVLNMYSIDTAKEDNLLATFYQDLARNVNDAKLTWVRPVSYSSKADRIYQMNANINTTTLVLCFSSVLETKSLPPGLKKPPMCLPFS